jgi:hypothetical protein
MLTSGVELLVDRAPATRGLSCLAKRRLTHERIEEGLLVQTLAAAGLVASLSRSNSRIGSSRIAAGPASLIVSFHINVGT